MGSLFTLNGRQIIKMELRLPSAISDSQMYCDIGINDFVRNGNISSQLMLPFIETVTFLETIPGQIFLTFFMLASFYSIHFQQCTIQMDTVFKV